MLHMQWSTLLGKGESKSSPIKVDYAVSLSFCTSFQIHYYDQLDIPRIKEYKGDSWSVSMMLAPPCNVRPVKVFINNPLLLKKQEVIISRTIGGILSERRFLIEGQCSYEGWFILTS